jgi:hypothetical protein
LCLQGEKIRKDAHGCKRRKKNYDAILQDCVLRQKFEEISQGHKGEIIDEAKALSIIEQEVLPLAARMGFFFTMNELQQYGTEMHSSDAGRELNDAEFQVVAGGANMACVGFGINVGEGLNGFCCGIGVTQ